MLNGKEISRKERSDIRTLMRFVGIYCREFHRGEKAPLSLKRLDIKQIEEEEVLVCPGCKQLLIYAITMRAKCPHDPKPMCKKCKSQCYRKEYKMRIREIMKFSGRHLIKHGRIDLIFHYFG